MDENITLKQQQEIVNEAKGLIEGIGENAGKTLEIVDTVKSKLDVLKQSFKVFSQHDEEVDPNICFWDGLDAMCQDMILELCKAHDILTDEIDRRHMIP